MISKIHKFKFHNFIITLKNVITLENNTIRKDETLKLFIFLKFILHEIKSIFLKSILNKHKNLSFFLTGSDGVNWSLDKDKKHAEKFLKINNINFSGSIFSSTHLFSIWLDSSIIKDYFWLSIFKKIFKFKIIVTVSYDIRFYRRKINELKEIIDIWVSPSRKIYNFLKERGFKVVLIPFYVSSEEFHFLNKTKEMLCNELNLDFNKIKNKIIIGSFQRDSLGLSLEKPKWQKNPDLLIKILRRLPRERYIILLAGPRRHYIIKECEKYNIPYLYYGDFSFIKDKKDDIFFNNHPPHKINLLYNLSDLIIVSSKIESGPKAILEASLSRILIFSTDVGLAKDFLHEDLIYSENNIKRIVNFIIDFNNNQEEIKKMIEFNHNQVQNVLNEKNYKKLYKQLINIK